MKNYHDILNEELLLTGLCRTSFNTEQAGMVKKLSQGTVNWDYFCRMASEHGIAALVYHNLEKLSLLNELPDETKNFLRQSLLISLNKNTLNTSSLVNVLKLLNKHKIKTVLLKGIALELTVYENEGIRQMTDIDVLMKREDCLKARSLLLADGFVEMPLKSVFYKYIIGYIGKHLPTLIKDKFRLELHHELFGKENNLLTRLLFDTSQTTEINGAEAFTPDPCIFFLYLVKHLSMHEMNNESQLRLYTDLVVMIEKEGKHILTPELIEYSEKAGMTKTLALHLEPLREFWGISFTECINEIIDKHSVQDSLNRFLYFLKSPKNNPVCDRSRLYRHTFNEVPGFHRKLLFLLGDLFPSVSFMKKRYNCPDILCIIPRYLLRWGKLWYLIKKNGYPE
ncbi:MAG TPA: nucleotidyltransferase family protein [Bacteroidales bacterium]|nr:nucleotidyltransferase family protein [Bacteroidales bacterium]